MTLVVPHCQREWNHDDAAAVLVVAGDGVSASVHSRGQMRPQALPLPNQCIPGGRCAARPYPSPIDAFLVFHAMQEAALADRLGSDTYRRLDLGLVLFGVWSFVVWLTATGVGPVARGWVGLARH
jgi:hypothetical protein